MIIHNMIFSLTNSVNSLELYMNDNLSLYITETALRLLRRNYETLLNITHDRANLSLPEWIRYSV